MDKPQDKLAKLRVMGKWKFILIYGVCGWGLLSAAIFAMLLLLQHRFNLAALLAPGYLKQLLAVVLIFPLGGCLWGLFMWRSMNKTPRN